MKVVFRVDASINIGTGHVMRCLTLAKALQDQDANVEFICREHNGHLIDYIQSNGFTVNTLSLVNETEKKHFTRPGKSENSLFHSAWLGVSQQQDASECLPILNKIKPNWLIVDHYGIDQQWQSELKPYYQKLMVIDDLGDRQHLCDILLDQNYGSNPKKYAGLVPQNGTLLTGSQYALLRPEFAQWRDFSLKRRQTINFNNLLITLGGVDIDNTTAAVLQTLQLCNLPAKLKITVVMGANAPHLQAVTDLAQQMLCELNIQVNVKVNVANMAELMANADLAIGAAGATTWERCCLGLPTIQMIIADNQKASATALAKDNIVKLLTDFDDLPGLVKSAKQWMPIMSQCASHVCDGLGAKKILAKLNAVNSQ